MSRDKKHISEDEKRKNFLMLVLIGILVAILVVIVIIMIPKGKKETNYQDLSSKVSDNKNLIANTLDKENVNRDKSKVVFNVDEESLTPEGASIEIIDTNEDRYVWTAIYSLEEKVNGKWKAMSLKNPENMTLTNFPIENVDGVFTQSIVWSNKYGVLDEGEYRIVKESTDGVKFYGEFTIK